MTPDLMPEPHRLLNAAICFAALIASVLSAHRQRKHLIGQRRLTYLALHLLLLVGALGSIESAFQQAPSGFRVWGVTLAGSWALVGSLWTTRPVACIKRRTDRLTAVQRKDDS